MQENVSASRKLRGYDSAIIPAHAQGAQMWLSLCSPPDYNSSIATREFRERKYREDQNKSARVRPLTGSVHCKMVIKKGEFQHPAKIKPEFH